MNKGVTLLLKKGSDIPRFILLFKKGKVTIGEDEICLLSDITMKVTTLTIEGGEAHFFPGSIEVKMPGSNDFTVAFNTSNGKEEVIQIQNVPGDTKKNRYFCERCGEISGKFTNFIQLQCGRCGYRWLWSK